MLMARAIDIFVKYLEGIDRAYQTIKGYHIELNLFNRFLAQKYNGPVYIEEITLQDMEDYLCRQKQKGFKPATRSRSIYIIRAFYKFCHRKEYIKGNLSLNLEPINVPRRERIFLSEDEFCKLLSYIRPRLVWLILNTLFYTGMRISECLSLTLKDVNFDSCVIHVKNTKNKSDRRIPMHKSLKPLLYNYVNNWRKGQNTQYFFSSNNNCRVSADYVNRVLREAVQDLKWNKKVTCHTLRHSFASRLVEKNINIVNIQKLLGHNDLATTSIYTHTSMKDLVNAINNI